MSKRLQSAIHSESTNSALKMGGGIHYRSDIDGLRALAVLPVVLFHADLSLFAGGFVGVDIFFVISGFLITNLLVQDFLQQKFSISDFYVRRVRRIFPALTATLLFSLALGFFVLLPNELAALGGAAKGVAYFSSNHLFWNTKNDYWSQNLLSTQPLLHTWSLSVEEQFYVLLPCLLALYYCFHGRVWARDRLTARDIDLSTVPLQGILLTFAVISFGLGQWMIRTDAAAAFYLLPFRAWELLLGSLLAVHLTGQPAGPTRAWYAETIGLTGLTLILYAIFQFDNSTPFPGIYALAPCVGAALVIYAGSGTIMPLTNKLLSWRPLVSIGLISYSLYLWHWPILVFIRSVGWHAWGLPSFSLPLVIIIIFFVSWFSWKWIEQPFRRRNISAMNGIELKIAAVMLCCCYVAGSLAQRVGEFAKPFRQPQPEVLVQLGRDLKNTPGARCEGNPELEIIKNSGGGCRLGQNTNDASPPLFALVGDSHARMWTAALDKLATESGVSGIGLTYSSCVPALGAVPPSRTECAEIIKAALEYLAISPIKNIVLAGYWIDAAKNAEISVGLKPKENGTEFYRAMDQTLNLLSKRGKNVYLMLDVPELKSESVPREKAVASIRHGGQAMYGPSIHEHKELQSLVEQEIARLQKKYGFVLIEPASRMCNKEGCLIAANGRTLYRDKHHLTDEAAIQFRDVFPSRLYEHNASMNPK